MEEEQLVAFAIIDDIRVLNIGLELAYNWDPGNEVGESFQMQERLTRS